jgi:hypothetical protein
MKRRYEKPAMLVVEVEQQMRLLVGSGTRGGRNPYGEPTDWNWG